MWHWFHLISTLLYFVCCTQTSSTLVGGTFDHFCRKETWFDGVNSGRVMGNSDTAGSWRVKMCGMFFLDVDLESSNEESRLLVQKTTHEGCKPHFSHQMSFTAKRIHKEFSSRFVAKVNALNTEEVDTSSAERTGWLRFSIRLTRNWNETRCFSRFVLSFTALWPGRFQNSFQPYHANQIALRHRERIPGGVGMINREKPMVHPDFSSG